MSIDSERILVDQKLILLRQEQILQDIKKSNENIFNIIRKFFVWFLLMANVFLWIPRISSLNK